MQEKIKNCDKCKKIFQETEPKLFIAGSGGMVICLDCFNKSLMEVINDT